MFWLILIVKDNIEKINYEVLLKLHMNTLFQYDLEISDFFVGYVVIHNQENCSDKIEMLFSIFYTTDFSSFLKKNRVFEEILLFNWGFGLNFLLQWV